MELALFALGTILLALLSRKSLANWRSHGFFRFWAWETQLGMLALNLRAWFRDPLSWHQLVSWALLTVSLLLVIAAVRLLGRTGRRDAARGDPALLGFEKTSQLVTTGLYRYIRHPMYSSLLFLGWGIFFKSPSWPGIVLALLSTFFLAMTARSEERENIAYFGDEYREYMRRSRMFIPFIF